MDFFAAARKNKVIPIAVFNSVDEALRIGEILLSGGITVLEVTLRTPEAINCISALTHSLPELMVGAGSVLSQEAVANAVEVGARFVVSPGIADGIAAAAKSRGLPFVPGAATPTELMAAMELSPVIKIFPASFLGGPAYINAISAPFASKTFGLIPTGGIDVGNCREYLSAQNVIACGMSHLLAASFSSEERPRVIRRRIGELKAVIADLQ